MWLNSSKYKELKIYFYFKDTLQIINYQQVMSLSGNRTSPFSIESTRPIGVQVSDYLPHDTERLTLSSNPRTLMANRKMAEMDESREVILSRPCRRNALGSRRPRVTIYLHLSLENRAIKATDFLRNLCGETKTNQSEALDELDWLKEHDFLGEELHDHEERISQHAGVYFKIQLLIY